MNAKRVNKSILAPLIAVLALFTTNVMAQDLKKPTLEDLIPGGETYCFAENLNAVQWWGDACIKPGIDSLIAINPKTGKETLLTTREKVNQVLAEQIPPPMRQQKTATATTHCRTSTMSHSRGQTNHTCSSSRQRNISSTTLRKKNSYAPCRSSTQRRSME